MKKINGKHHFVYILIISGLAAYIFYTRHQKKLWFRTAEQVLKSQGETRNEIGKINDRIFDAIENQSLNYPCKQTSSTLLQAKTTRRLCAAFLNFTDDIRKKHWVGSNKGYLSSTKGLLKNQEEKEILTQRFKLFRDSICVMLQNDTAMLNAIRPQFSFTEELLHTHREDQKLLYLANLDIQVLTIVHDFLQFLDFKTSSPERFESFLPNLILKQTCIKSGEPFYGLVSLVSFSPHSRNITIYCNDKKLLIQDGLGKMRLKIAPGDLKYTIKILIHNPVTGRTEDVVKEFPINLCKE